MRGRVGNGISAGECCREQLQRLGISVLTRHRTMIYDLTGPESITQRQQVEAIGRALDRPVRFEELGRAEARAGMSSVMPATVADTLLDYLAGAVGRPGKTDATVTAVTGRPARTYQSWAYEHADRFR